MEKNEILVFTPETLADIPSLAAAREHKAYLDELHKHCRKSISCAKVCDRLLDHRLSMPWDQDGSMSLLFPMVRSKRLLLGKCAIHGIPEDVAIDIWDIHRLCLGSFLPPAEMDDPSLHRIFTPFEQYRGHLVAKHMKRLADPERSEGYLRVLESVEGPEDVKQDIASIADAFRRVAQDTVDEGHERQSLLAMVGLLE